MAKLRVKSVNTSVLDKSIQHSVYLEHFKTGEAQQIITMLNDDVLPDLVDQLYKRLGNIATRGYDTSPANTLRLRQLIQANYGLIRGGVTQLSGKLSEDLNKLALTEAEWQASLLKKLVPFNVEFTVPSPALLKGIVTARPMQGHLMSKWWDGIAQTTQSKLTQQLNIGLTQGEGVDQIVRRIKGTAANNYSDGILNATRRNVEAIVRTSTNHVVTQARETTYEENTQVIGNIQIVATLDSRTTLICIKQDKKIYPINSGPRPPFHWGCRTTTVPILKSWDELGIKGLKELPESTRASMDGQVAESEDYGSWLSKQDAGFQDDVLGPKRAELFRAGDATVDDFVTDKNRVLTLDQLASKT